MRNAFILLIVIHALIHLLGFFKAFNLFDIKQLSQVESRTSGLLWLLTTLLFIVLAIMLLAKYNHWWLIGCIAVLISQILIITVWNDAKFGTIFNLIILTVSLYGLANQSFAGRYERDVINNFSQKNYYDTSVITEKDIEHMPESLKKYLRFTGSIGRPKVNNFKVEFSGNIRKNDQSEWMPFNSQQYNFIAIPSRLFFMRAVMKYLPVAGYHSYFNGKAIMDIRLFSLIKVQYAEGRDMDVAETVTFFNDMCCMAPPTLIDRRISWREIETNIVEARFTHNDITITAELHFNEQGQLINFISNDRFNFDAGKRLSWSTPLKDYKEFNGYKLAGYAEAIYSYPDKELCYGTFKTVSVEYNRSSIK